MERTPMDRQTLIGHLALIFTVAVWGTTFVSTKILLVELTPLEILFYRFLLGAGALTLAYPHLRHGGTWRDEGLLALAGLSGVTLYYLFENIALDYSTASNVSVIIVKKTEGRHRTGSEAERFHQSLIRTEAQS